MLFHGMLAVPYIESPAVDTKAASFFFFYDF